MGWFSGDKETNNAIGRGEATGLFSGEPKGRPTWGTKFLSKSELVYPWYNRNSDKRR